MSAFKILLAIALIMSTINCLCSADPKEECSNIIFTTFEEEVGSSIVDFMRQNSNNYGFFMFKQAYHLFTVNSIKNQFFKKENSQLNNYRREIKVNLLLDYFNNVYNLDEVNEQLKAEETLVPKDWCLQKAEEEIDQGQYRHDSFSKDDHRKSCLFLLERLQIDVETDEPASAFLTFYENWTIAIINYGTIFANQHNLIATNDAFPIGEKNMGKAMYYIQMKSASSKCNLINWNMQRATFIILVLIYMMWKKYYQF